MAETKRARKSKLIGENIPLTREEFKTLERLERIQLIKKLIPIGLMAVAEELQDEVDEILGSHHNDSETTPVKKYGTNPGSVVLGNQRVPIRVPRLRGESGEIALESYAQLHHDGVSETLYQSILQGVSCRDFESTIENQGGSISKSKSTVSRRFVEASKGKLKLLHNRDLSKYDFIALFIDGTPFANDQMIIALGITVFGEKIILGFTQAGTENKLVVSQFLTSLIDRGLNISKGLLAVTDGSKGLISGLKKAFYKHVVIQRCQWHKRENVVSYMPKIAKESLRGSLRLAYGRPNLEEAMVHIERILVDLEDSNQSAASSLREGLDETLTLHRMGLYAKLGRSFKTSNCLESINASAEKYCGKVDYWKTSEQKQRWLACALLEIEPKLNKVSGKGHLLELRKEIMIDLKL